MSDRGNVLFHNRGRTSVVISSYSGGLGFVTTAIHYAIELKKEVDKLIKERPNLGTPLTRLEPEVIAVDFIRALHDKGWITGRDDGFRLYKSEREVEDIYRIDLNNPSKLLNSERLRKYWEG